MKCKGTDDSMPLRSFLGVGVSRADAGAHPEGGSHSGQDGDDDVDDFLPKFLFVHGVFEL